MRKYSFLLLILFFFGACSEDESVIKETEVESLRQDIRSLKREMKKEIDELKNLLAGNVDSPEIASRHEADPEQNIDSNQNDVSSASSITQMGEIAIFNESVGWTNLAAAKADTEKILRAKFAKRIKVYNDDHS